MTDSNPTQQQSEFLASLNSQEQAHNQQLNQFAKDYVTLSLGVGEHSEYFVDAYYGPEEWRATGEAQSLISLTQDIKTLCELLTGVDIAADSFLYQRHQFLLIQSKALLFYAKQLAGQTASYERESELLYDAKVPFFDEVYFDDVLRSLDTLIPGEGELNQRLAAYRQQFIVPPSKLSTVFDAAIEEARKRTLARIDLPTNENFRVELTNNQVWSAYNWYKGNSYSLIELNTDHPIFIERVIDLAAHEGYPGHHVFNALIEKHLVNERGWLEYSIYNLYSPVSLLAEGSANYGIEVAFPWDERLAFERDVLFPLAGLDPEQVEQYYNIQRQLHRLSYVDNLIAQRWINGDIDDDKACEMLVKYALNSPERAKQRLAFIKHNRAYVMNYNYGQDLVKEYLAKQVTDDSHDALWQAFTDLLAEPKTASMMTAG